MARGHQARADKVREMYDRPHTDPYMVLGVDRAATADEIKSAYRKYASEHHPDVNPGREKESGEKFREGSEAYDVLSDDFKRAWFDKHGVEGKRRRAVPPPEPSVAASRETSTYESSYSRRDRDEDKPRNIFIGNYNGTAHYHFGSIPFCIVCGVKT